MSIGTPFLCASGSAAAGSTTLAVTVGNGIAGTPSSPAGNVVAVCVSENLTTANISTVTDTKGNVYTAVPLAQGTAQESQWFICPNALALAGGVDIITLTCTATFGAKTLHAISCPGVQVTSPLDQDPTGTFGNSTTPSQTCPAGTQQNELLLASVVNQGTGGAFTFSSPINQLGQVRPTGAQYHTVGADVLTSAGSVSVTGTIGSAVNWLVNAITLFAAPATPSLTGKVGSTTPIQAYTQSGCYDFGKTQAEADNEFITAVNRSQNGHLSKTKKFWNEGTYELTGPRSNDLANYLSFGTKVMFALFPPHINYTAADLQPLHDFLVGPTGTGGIKGLGFNASNAEICLWQEPEIGNKFGAANKPAPLGSAGFQAAMAFFGPTVLAAGFPLVLDIGMGQGVPGWLQYFQAGLAAAGCTYTAAYADFYYGAFSATGIIQAGRLSQPAAAADAAGLPFGLGEFGMHVTDDYRSMFNYITGFFQARLAANKHNADLGWYQGQCSLTGAGDLTSPILTSTDPRVPFYQAMFDTLTSPPVTNTVTVTNPGNQSGTTGVAIAPLTITATDSDSSQTLTFSAQGLPAGLSINPTTGVISGTPTIAGVSNVTVTATDGTGASGSTGFTWSISVPVTNTVTVTNPGTQNTQLGAVVSLQMAATDSGGAGALPFVWGAAGLPTGLAIGSATGLITGNPTKFGTFNVSVTATDNTGSNGTANFTWNVTNPNVLKAGAFTTIPPVSGSPIAGLGLAGELTYEIALGLTAGAGSTIPFCAVVVSFYDFDELPSLQTPVDIVTYRCPMGTNGDANGPAVIFGRGPQRGAFMRIQAHNVDTVDATLAFAQVVGTARQTAFHDWRWDCGGNAPVIPGYTNATAASASLVLGGIKAVSVPAGQTFSRLCSMFSGKAYFRAQLATGGPPNIVFRVTPQPPSLWTNQDIFSGVVTAGSSELTSPANFTLPRGPVLMTFDNTAGAQAATVTSELIATEY